MKSHDHLSLLGHKCSGSRVQSSEFQAPTLPSHYLLSFQLMFNLPKLVSTKGEPDVGLSGPYVFFSCWQPTSTPGASEGQLRRAADRHELEGYRRRDRSDRGNHEAARPSSVVNRDIAGPNKKTALSAEVFGPTWYKKDCILHG